MTLSSGAKRVTPSVASVTAVLFVTYVSIDPFVASGTQWWPWLRTELISLRSRLLLPCLSIVLAGRVQIGSCTDNPHCICSPFSFFLFQVTGVTERKPNKKHKRFTVSAEQVTARNISIAASWKTSELNQEINKLAPKERHAAMLQQAQELAILLHDNRHHFPKKPLRAGHLRGSNAGHVWYTELFGLTAPLQHAKANLVFDLFKKLLNE